MKKRTLIVVAGLVTVAALVVGGTAIAQGTGTLGGDDAVGEQEDSDRAERESERDDADALVTGPAAERARAAALRVAGGGTASVERDSDNAYEVEVTRSDGSVVDVDLDASFNVVPDGEDSD